MDTTRLTRQSHRKARPGLRLLDRFDLAGARAHEFCGPARRRLALWLARGSTGQVLWIRPDWHPDALHMAGVRAEIDPGRLVTISVLRPADLLWTMEEVLRSGLISLVVADLPEAPGLTPVRRLHLAAEAGAERTGRAGIGLLLVPGDGGAAGVETRWSLAGEHGGPQVGQWRLARLRARSDPPADWAVERDAKGAPRIARTEITEPA